MTAPITKVRKPRKDKGVKRAPRAKAPKEHGTCLFSGLPTKGKKSRFLPGNDAKLKSILLKVVAETEPMSAIPKHAVEALKAAPLLGFKITESGNLRKTAA